MKIDELSEAFQEMFDFITDMPSGLDGFESDFDEAFEQLKQVKSDDVQEVVRCKDCKYLNSNEFCEGNPPDFYCADGYNQIETELKPIKDFLFYCGNKYHEKGVRYCLSRLIIKRQFRIGTRKIMDNIDFDVPRDLHDKIIDAIEQYVDEKEKEKQEI